MVGTAPGAATARASYVTRHLASPFAFAVLALAWFAAARLGALHVDYNDFWGIAFYANRLSLSDPASFHNGFYPIGYPLLLRVIGGASHVTVATALNAFLAAALVLVGAALARHNGGRVAATVTAIALCLHPLVFQYATQPAPDVGAAALCCAGALLLAVAVSQGGRGSTTRLAMAGALLGCAALFRYHALVLAVGLVLGFTVMCRRRAALAAWAGLGAVYAVQALANVMSGSGPFETAQAFNVYRMVNGVSWHHVADIHVPGSWLAIAAANPSRFASAYLRSLSGLWFLLVPSAALTAPLWSRTAVLSARMFAIAMAVFVVVVSVGASSRASLVALPLCAAQAGVLISAAMARASNGAGRQARVVIGTAVVAAGALVALFWLRQDAGLLQRRARAHDRNARLEQMLREEGMTRAREVFTDDFSLYLPGLAPDLLYTAGGWAQIAIPAFRQQFPPLCLQSVDCFAADAIRQRVGYVVLGASAADLMKEFGELYRTPTARWPLRPLGNVDDLKAFAIVAASTGMPGGGANAPKQPGATR